ncbi:MAG TPA: tryptophan synthase subunit alpha [Longimicrobiales bacterium]|nr:tryptophan synthase subunit alpha [Longimicrobiales bacterium]
MSVVTAAIRARPDVGVDAIAGAFARSSAERRAALVPFLAAGDPTSDAFVEIAVAAATAGADLLEVGLPFADSLADGPIIQAAYGRALAAGIDTDGVLRCVERIAARARTPIVLMTAYNPIHARGTLRFVDEAAAAGVSGLLVPDLPLEDSDALRDAAARAGLAVILLVAPDTPEERATRIARAATGFVYVVRRRGVTGAGGEEADTRRRIEALRESGALPVAVGFGIATPDDAARAGEHADGVIVGSALVEVAARAEREASGSAADAVARAVESFARALRGGRDTTHAKVGSGA